MVLTKKDLNDLRPNSLGDIYKYILWTLLLFIVYLHLDVVYNHLYYMIIIHNMIFRYLKKQQLGYHSIYNQ